MTNVIPLRKRREFDLRPLARAFIEFYGDEILFNDGEWSLWNNDQWVRDIDGWTWFWSSEFLAGKGVSREFSADLVDMAERIIEEGWNNA